MTTPECKGTETRLSRLRAVVPEASRDRNRPRRKDRPMKIMPQLLFVVLCCIAVFGCSPSSQDSDFITLADRCIETSLAMDPEWATAAGDHRFDHKMTDRTLEAYQARRDHAAAYLDSLATLDPERLTAANRIDLAILVNHLELTVFTHDELAPHRSDPRLYGIGSAINGLLARDFAPLRDRLENVRSRLEQIPAVLTAAQANLQRPPRIHTETVIGQTRGEISLILDDLGMFLDQEPDLRSSFTGPRARAIAALDQHAQWLENELLPRSDGEFRLGRELFERKLQLTLETDISIDEIQAAAAQDLENTLAAMLTIATPMYVNDNPEGPNPDNVDPAQVIAHVLDSLADIHPNADNIVTKARTGLVTITDFVREHHLVTVPDDPVEIIVMPEYQRGFAIAYCDAPGPLADNEKTFYSIAPPPESWSAESKESYFREYNDFMLQNLTIHEAMPGHYLQLAHANAFHGDTLVRALFGSGVFIEGWATYAEQIMAEHGYGAPSVPMQQLKMRLRLIINAMIDYRLHCEGLTEAEAMDLMTRRGFQEEGEAAGKWRRAVMSSCQLSTYYVGNLEMNRLRDLAQQQHGDQFKLGKFHDELLSFGSPAPKHIQTLMEL